MQTQVHNKGLTCCPPESRTAPALAAPRRSANSDEPDLTGQLPVSATDTLAGQSLCHVSAASTAGCPPRLQPMQRPTLELYTRSWHSSRIRFVAWS